MRMLTAVRDRVLDAARLIPGATLLDVGCGDGLIGFGAIDRVGPDGRVVFADISQPLLDRCAEIAREIGVESQCRFVRTSADDLRGIEDASVDGVTTRSVLIYVKDKASAFREFSRVLKPRGSIALWEPINRFTETYRSGEDWWRWPQAEQVRELTERLRDAFRRLQPPETDPMLDFDEVDLVRLCEDAGFRRIELSHTIEVRPAAPVPWQTYIGSAGNPNIPTLDELIREIFSPDERARFESIVRPIMEGGGYPQRSSTVLLRARKDGPRPGDLSPAP